MLRRAARSRRSGGGRSPHPSLAQARRNLDAHGAARGRCDGRQSRTGRTRRLCVLDHGLRAGVAIAGGGYGAGRPGRTGKTDRGNQGRRLQSGPSRRGNAGQHGSRGPALSLCNDMRSLSTAPFLVGAVLLAILCGLQQASAQPIAAPARPVATPSQRGASCHNGMSFDRFLADLKQQAIAAGVSQRTIAEASPYLVYDQGIVNRDRGQRVFGQVFTEFAGRMAASYRMQQGQARIKAHAAAFARAEKEYGVPPAVIAAFWGLESDFGANTGSLHTLPSLVSLAYDCRRAEMFEKETIAALKIIERGDLTPSEMIGSWAGELGQTQFLPTHYFNYAVDYDGDGHRNLLRSGPDVIGSTANYIATGLQWRRGEPWLQEVRVPANLPWEHADLTIQHPRSKLIAF